MDFSILKDAVTSICAIGGLTLGIYNLLKSFKDDKVVLTIKPLSFHKMGDNLNYGFNENRIQADREFSTLGVKIINLSKFDITITETGMVLKEGDKRLVFPEAFILDSKGSLPFKLSSRESTILCFKPEQLPVANIRSSIAGIYIHTACDLEFVGAGGVIDDFGKT